MRTTFFFLLSFLVSSHAYAEKQLVKIGVIAPLSGQFSYAGDDIRKVLSILEPSFESDNFKAEFIYEDGKCGIGNSATTAAHKLINIDKVKYLITGCSGETLQAGPLAQQNKVVTFAVLSNHADIKKLGDFVFRTYVDIERGMQILSTAIKNSDDLPIAILTEDNAFTQGMKAFLHKLLEGQIVFSDDFVADEVNFRTLIIKSRSKNPKSYYFNCAGPRTCANLINQARNLGVKEQIYSYVYTEHPEVLEAAKGNVDGIKYLTTPDIDQTSEQFKEFMTKFIHTYQEPKMDFLVRSTFDAASAVWNEVLLYGDDSTKVKEELYSYSKLGALGQVSFDRNGDVKGINNVIKIIKSGKPSSITF